MPNSAPLPLFTPLAGELADMLAGPLAAAEGRLEEARRVLWTHHFTGHPMADVAFGLAVPALALVVAERVVQASRGHLLAAENLLLEVRMCLYAGAFAWQPESRFGQAFGCSIEKMLAEEVGAARPAAGGHLNSRP